MRVLITSVGSSPGLDIARSLRMDKSLYLIGADNSYWGRRVADDVCDEIIKIPHSANSPTEYITFLDEYSRKVDFIFIGLDVEVEIISNNNFQFHCPTHIPSNDASKIFLNKYKTFDKCGDKTIFPGSCIANNNNELEDSLRKFNNSAWVRPAEGTSGVGSFHATNFEMAKNWIKLCEARGIKADWLVQEFLPGRNINWTGLYKENKLIASAAMERLEYILANVSISGITGQVKRCKTIFDKQSEIVSEVVLGSIEKNLNGIYSVDLRGDKNGVVKVTEVNVRFAGRNWLYTNAGLNLPLITLYANTNQEYAHLVTKMKLGVEMYRQIDSHPFFKSENE